MCLEHFTVKFLLIGVYVCLCVSVGVHLCVYVRVSFHMRSLLRTEKGVPICMSIGFWPSVHFDESLYCPGHKEKKRTN